MPATIAPARTEPQCARTLRGQPRCEGCGATSEAVHGFAAGGAGGSAAARYGTTWQAPQRADVVLGHAGWLCNACWWRA